MCALYLTSVRIRPRFKLWFVGENGEHVFGLGTMRLLVEIVRLSSTSAAARELGMSYRYALERLTIVEKRLGILSLKGREVAKKAEEPI
jgi:molybdenum-dependent DNA-binding transcriptional regulator ModE